MPPEIAAQLMITDATLNKGIDEKLTKQMSVMLIDSFAQRFLVDGARAKNTTMHWEREPEFRAWTLGVATEEDLDDPSLRQLLVRADMQHTHLMGSLFAVDRLPWWRFLWLKLRGRPVVEFEPC